MIAQQLEEKKQKQEEYNLRQQTILRVIHISSLTISSF